MKARRALRRPAALAALATAVVVLTFTLPGCAAAPRANTVSIHDLRFDPAQVTVAAGTTVTWVNNDQAAHTIVTDDLGVPGRPQAGQFSSPPLNTGGSFEHTFDVTGSFRYHCAIHPYIKGTVIVR
jgi:plastocyanin